MIDERSDWYELSNNTWLNKDQRNYAEQMLEIEKKRADEIDKKIGKSSLKFVENIKLTKLEKLNLSFNKLGKSLV